MDKLLVELKINNEKTKGFLNEIPKKIDLINDIFFWQDKIRIFKDKNGEFFRKINFYNVEEKDYLILQNYFFNMLTLSCLDIRLDYIYLERLWNNESLFNKDSKMKIIKDDYIKSIFNITFYLSDLLEKDLEFIICFNKDDSIVKEAEEELCLTYNFIVDKIGGIDNTNELIKVLSEMNIKHNSILSYLDLFIFYLNKRNFDLASIYYKEIFRQYEKILGEGNLDNKRIVFCYRSIKNIIILIEVLIEISEFEKAEEIYLSIYNYAYKFFNLINNDDKESKVLFDKELKNLNEIKDEILEKKNIKELKLINFDVLNKCEYFNDKSMKIMPDIVKRYLSSALQIYEFIDKNEYLLDYSSFTMPLMKAVEYLLFIIFKESYLPYLLEREENDRYFNHDFIKQKFKVKLNDTEYRIKKTDEFIDLEFGDALNAISRYDFNNQRYVYGNKYFNEYCYDNNMNNVKENITYFIDCLNKIRLKRNLSAHMNKVTKEDAEECKEYLFTNLKFINFLLNTFSFAFE